MEFAGWDDSHFQKDFSAIQPSPGFLTIEDEILALDAMTDPSYPPQLREKPGFIFCAYRGGPDNKQFFDRLIQTQKKIQNLLQRPDFLEEVLAKIGGKNPLIICKKPNQKDFKICADFTVHEWANILRNAADRFDDQQHRLEFFESYYRPTEACHVPPKMVGASIALLSGLKKALSNLSATDRYFEILAKDKSLKAIIPDQLYFKTTGQGQGKRINREPPRSNGLCH